MLSSSSSICRSFSASGSSTSPRLSTASTKSEPVRKEQLLQTAKDIIDNGEKPSARKLADKTGFHQRDVHGLLNALERDGEIESYTEEVLGRRLRRVSLIRQK